MTVTPLQESLNYVATHPSPEWLCAVENVPKWPRGHPLLAQPTLPESVDAYESSQGRAELLLAIGKSRAESAAELAHLPVVTNGGLHGLSLIFRDLRDVGVRDIVCQVPVLSNIYRAATSAGLRVSLAPTSQIAAIVGANAQHQMAVYLSSPHNPTGDIVEWEHLEELLSLFTHEQSRLIVDAAYDAFCFTGPPLEHTPHPQMMWVNSVSKNFGSPGLRIGWIEAREEDAARLMARLEFECIAVSGTNQHFASRLLQHGNHELVQHVAQGREQVLTWWRANRSVFGPSELVIAGGTQAWLQLSANCDEVALSRMLLERHKLALVYSNNYVGCERPHIRLPLGGPTSQLEQVLNVLEAALSSQ